VDAVLVVDETNQAFAIELAQVEVPVTAGGSAATERMTTPTGIRDRAEQSVNDLAQLLARIAGDFGRAIAGMDDAARPSAIEAEVCLGLSAQLGPVWVLGGKGEYSVRAKLTWSPGG
jgi:hypothetical protein